MIITADTNVLVRAVVGDDPQQSAMASAALRRAYGFADAEISSALRALIDADNVRLDRPAADGVIAHEGQWLGGDLFVSFDRQAVALLRTQGIAAELLS